MPPLLESEFLKTIDDQFLAFVQIMEFQTFICKTTLSVIKRVTMFVVQYVLVMHTMDKENRIHTQNVVKSSAFRYYKPTV